jgi:hypothetical protein
MYIDHDRARIVFDTLVRALKEKVHPYDVALRPQDIVGELSSYTQVQQANFWFYACMYMRGPINSNFAVERLFEIFREENGEGIFDPSDIRSQRPFHIVRVMEKYNFTRMLKDVKRFWAFGSQIISQMYEGDARNIYIGITTFDELVERVTYKKETLRAEGGGFIGFQKKMAAMLTYFLYDSNLIDFDQFPPPVDFHLMRVMILTEVLRLDDEDPSGFRYEKTSPFGFEVIEQYLKNPETEPVMLGDALWLLSGNLCSKSPRNREPRSFGVFDAEKIDATALSKKKPLEAHPGLFSNSTVNLPIHIGEETLEMRNTCGLCPVKQFCRDDVGMPAVKYYRDGKLSLRPLVTHCAD